MKGKSMKGFAWLAVIMCLMLVLSMAGCRRTDPETTQPETTEEIPTTTEETPTTTEAEDEEPEIIQAGTMSADSRGKNGDEGVYFRMEPNDVPADSSWATEFRPTTADAIQLIRDGETYNIGKSAAGMVIKFSDTEYYLKLEQWIIRDYYPITDGDILKINGVFRNGAADVFFQIDTTYIQYTQGLVLFSTEYPEGSGVNVRYVGNMTADTRGANGSDGIYFQMEKNSLPYKTDWSLEYKPADESAVQLIRNGRTYNIANTAAGMIVKFSETEYYLKLEKWIIKDYYPIQDGDIIVVSGKFTNSENAVVASFAKTYISLKDGLLKFSTTYPTGEDEIKPVLITGFASHPNGYTGTGLYFYADENDIVANSDWSTEYRPKDSTCVRLIRDGKTYEIGNTAAGALIKFSDTEWYLKLEQWIYQDYFPFQSGDILHLSGKFVNSGTAEICEIKDLYISIADGMAFLSETYPEETVEIPKIQAGTMFAHSKGWTGENNGNAGGLYFTMAENSAPYVTDWSTRYQPQSNSCVKLIRDGKTYEVGNTGAGMIVKYSDTEYYLEFWPMGDCRPIREGDILVVEGNFVDGTNGVILVVDKTYISLKKGVAKFSTTYPTDDDEPEQELNAGNVIAAENTALNGGVGFYFGMSNGSVIPTNGDNNWDNRFMPTSADTLKLIRDGVTTSIGNTGAGEFVKYSETGYYMDLAAWSHPNVTPFVSGDVLVIEGYYTNGTVVFKVEKSVITIGENGNLSFATEEPEKEPNAGNVIAAENTALNGGVGFYFGMSNGSVIPTNGDNNWDNRFMPTTADTVKLTRDGVTTSIGNTAAGEFVKYSETGYYMDLAAWSHPNVTPFVSGDVLVIEGYYTNGTVVFKVEKSIITIGEDGNLSFATEDPEEELNAGNVIAAENIALNGGTGFYFNLSNGSVVPTDGDNNWDNRFMPTTTDTVKLIRDGVTTSIGNTAAGEFVKYSETGYYMDLAEWSHPNVTPFVSGDVLVIEGYYTNGTVVFKVEKSIITIGEDGNLSFTTDGTGLPDEKDVQAGHMSCATMTWNANDSGWFDNNTALYFALAPNDVPASPDWDVEYSPERISNLQLTRDGETYNIGILGRGTVIKVENAIYVLKLETWTIGEYAPLQVGDVLTVEGRFVGVTNANGETSDYKLTISKTQITIGEDYVLSYTNMEDSTPSVIEAGKMTAHTDGWNTLTNKSFSFTLPENTAPADASGTIAYTPTSESAVTLIRDGVSQAIANPAREIVAKLGDTHYQLRLESWTIGEYAPIVPGDILVVDGNFYYAVTDTTIHIEKTVVIIGENYALTYADEVPDPNAGNLIAAENTELNGGTGFYFNLSNGSVVPTDGDNNWDNRFMPTSADTVKLIRDGVTTSIGNTAAGEFVKYSENGYYMDLAAWSHPNVTPFVSGDVLVIEGYYTNGAVTFQVEKTFIQVGADNTFTFSTEDPADADVIKAGAMGAHTTGLSNSILYFTMAENDLASHRTKTDYRPFTASVISIIRDGKTYEVADSGKKTMEKYTSQNYKLHTDALTMELQDGDVLVISGKFTGGHTDQDETYTFSVTTTYITIVSVADGKVTFSTTAP